MHAGTSKSAERTKLDIAEFSPLMHACFLELRSIAVITECLNSKPKLPLKIESLADRLTNELINFRPGTLGSSLPVIPVNSAHAMHLMAKSFEFLKVVTRMANQFENPTDATSKFIAAVALYNLHFLKNEDQYFADIRSCSTPSVAQHAFRRFIDNVPNIAHNMKQTMEAWHKKNPEEVQDLVGVLRIVGDNELQRLNLLLDVACNQSYTFAQRFVAAILINDVFKKIAVARPKSDSQTHRERMNAELNETLEWWSLRSDKNATA